jgi:hypothetical protein
VQNVVTYATVIDVPNPQLKLKPGMTPTVTIEIARKADVIRVPVAALRFRPSGDVFAAFNQEAPQDWQQGPRRGGDGNSAASGTPGAPPSGAPAGGGGTPAPAATPAGGGNAAAPASATAPAGSGAARNAGARDGRGAGRDASAAPTAAAAPGGGAGPGGGPRGERTGDGGAASAQAGGPEGGAQAGAGQGQGPGGGGGGASLDPEERRRRMAERMQNMGPEEREQFMQRMRARGIDPQALQGGGAGAPRAEGASRGGPADGGRAPAGAASQGRPGAGARPAVATAQTIDSLFGPLPATETPGRVWLYINNQLKPVRLRLGISDGTYSELIGGDLEAGAEVVTAVTLPAQAAAGAPGRSPLMGPSRGPGGPPPGGGGAPSGGGGPRPSGH